MTNLQQLEDRIRDLVPSTVKPYKHDENSNFDTVLHPSQMVELETLQLHHVLQAIKIKTEDSVKSFTMTAAGCMDFSENSIPRYFHVYDITKDLSGQNEDTINFLLELIK